ncbi:MAG: universal stress protein [Geminicoccaceae bacterium]
MAIRVFLTPLFHNADDKLALEMAFVLAKRFRGHVDALLVQPDPVDAIPMISEGVSTDAIRRLMEDAAAAMEQQKQVASTVFKEAVSAAEMAIVERGDMSLGQPSAAFQEASGQIEEVVPAKALTSDLVVFGTASSEKTPGLRPTFEAVLLKSRRPILLAPAIPGDHIGHNVAIAWNGTPESRSALAAAMPFLKSAVAVHLLTAASSRTDADALHGVKDYLAWHGIGSESHVVEPGGESVGAALMHRATAIGADLLVMGGYGHARLRERILGGVTHHIVNHPELPILLAH